MPDQCITLQHIELRLVEEKRKVQEDKGVILRCQWDCIKTKGKERASERRSRLAVPCLCTKVQHSKAANDQKGKRRGQERCRAFLRRHDNASKNSAVMLSNGRNEKLPWAVRKKLGQENVTFVL